MLPAEVQAPVQPHEALLNSRLHSDQTANQECVLQCPLTGLLPPSSSLLFLLKFQLLEGEEKMSQTGLSSLMPPYTRGFPGKDGGRAEMRQNRSLTLFMNLGLEKILFSYFLSHLFWFV